jgi:hypothetical protein
MSRTLVPLFLAATLLPACVAENSTIELIREAMPDESEVRVEVPTADTTTGRTVGEISAFYLHTRNTSEFLNGASVRWVGLIATIMAFPATSTDGDTVTWGPWDSDNALRPFTYQLVATRTGERAITYVLSGRKQAETGEFIPLIEGSAERPVAGERGRGTLRLLFDNQAALDTAAVERGSVTLAYDLTTEPRTSHITFTEFSSREITEPRNMEYDFQLAADRSGRFDFLSAADVDKDDAQVLESLHVISHWTATGAGRSDAVAWGGSLGEAVWAVEQCWDTAFLTTFTSYVAEGGEVPVDASEGDPSSCALEGEVVEPGEEAL